MPDGLNAMIELLKQMHPDIIICDALSEKSDCLSLIKFIKEGKLTSHIPVILLSTAQQVDERIKGVESGADICLTLPLQRRIPEGRDRAAAQTQPLAQGTITNRRSAPSNSPTARCSTRTTREFIDKMLKIINDNISNTEISTKFIADEMGVGIRNLYRRLEGILNQTPTTIIKEYRLAKAEQLLTLDQALHRRDHLQGGVRQPGHILQVLCRQIRLHPQGIPQGRSSPRSNRRSTKCPKSHRIRHRQCYRQCRNLCPTGDGVPFRQPTNKLKPGY